MISYISKIVGFSLLGAEAVGTSIAYGVSQLSSKSLSILLSEEDRQWQFLYKLSQKLFDSLKLNSESELSKNPKDNLIKWLKEKFSSSLTNEDDKWENFKSLCEEQKPRETKSEKEMNNEYARLCFLDEGDNPKGFLHIWHEEEIKTEISPDYNIAFLDLTKKNIELWNSFKTKYPNANPIDKFDEWYSSNENEAQEIRKSMNIVVRGQTSEDT